MDLEKHPAPHGLSAATGCSQAGWQAQPVPAVCQGPGKRLALSPGNTAATSAQKETCSYVLAYNSLCTISLHIGTTQNRYCNTPPSSKPDLCAIPPNNSTFKPKRRAHFPRSP